MQHFIFNLAEGDRERAKAFLRAKKWPIDVRERHRDALAPGDLALVFLALTREFVGRATVTSAFLDRMSLEPVTSDPAVGGVVLDVVEDWTSGVALDVVVQRIDPKGVNPNVQANAPGFRTGVVLITAKEFDSVVSLHDSDLQTGR